MPDIANPYIAGNPVTGPEMFFGREDIFDFVHQTLTGQHRDNVLVLYGQRRTGKTSVLYQMSHHLGERYLCILVDLHGLALNGLGGFLWELANHIARHLRREYKIELPPLTQEPFNTDPRDAFENTFLDGVWTAIGDRHLLLMLDEAIRLEEQILAGKLEADVFEYLRHLMQHDERLNFLFSLGSGLEEMQKEYAFLFNVALYKKISFLDHHSAADLITQPARDLYQVEPKAVERILAITSGHPYYTQLICHSLFNRTTQADAKVVQEQDVDAVLDEAVERGLAVLKHVWEESTPAEKAVVAGMAEAMGKKAHPVESAEIGRACKKYGIDIPAGEMATAIKTLIAREVITGTDRYAFTVELQRLWVVKYRRVEWVKEEIEPALGEWAARPSIPPTPQAPPTNPAKRWLRLGTGLVIAVFVICLGCITLFNLPQVRGILFPVNKTPTPDVLFPVNKTPTPDGTYGFITDVVLAKDVQGAHFDPVGVTTSFPADQGVFHAVVTIANAPDGMEYKANWMVVNNGGADPPGQSMASAAQVVSGSRNLDFAFTPDHPLPAGHYQVEIYRNGSLVRTLDFKVFSLASQTTTAPAETSGFITNVVTAQDVNGTNFEPVGVTSSFSADQPVYHAVVTIANAPEGTVYKANWKVLDIGSTGTPGQSMGDYTISAGGSRNLDFSFKPQTKLPPGKYQVEIYANGALSRSADFEVQAPVPTLPSSSGVIIPGGEAAKISDLAVTGDTVWAATEGGLVRWTAPDQSRRTAASKLGFPDNCLEAIVAAPDGSLWMGCGGVAHVRPSGDSLVDLGYYNKDNGLGMGVARALLVDKDGSVWAGGVVGGGQGSPLSHFDGQLHPDGKEWQTNEPLITALQPYLPFSINSLLRAQDGALWLGLHDHGFLRWDGSQWTKIGWPEGIHPASDADQRIRRMVQDQNGTIWAAASLVGLLRFDPASNGFQRVELPGYDGAVHTIAQGQDGRLGVGGDHYVAGSSDGGQTWTQVGTSDGLGEDISGLVVDSNGRVWAGAYGDGMSILDGDIWRPLQQ
jgi:hypothetical protein